MADVTLFGPDGRPIDRGRLKEEIAKPDGTGVRSILSGHPAQGLTPGRLTGLLREAEQGDPQRYLELAEEMEEKDLHYLGVLGARKRAVAGLELVVEGASDDVQDRRNADLVRDALARQELQAELIDILDAVGKGFSVTEIVWDASLGQWMPARFEWRDPRWFRFDITDGTTILRREAGGDVPLEPWKFVTHVVKAKSGLPLRGGLARAAAWGYLFKNLDIKDWVSFAETYGQPMRIGKYHSGATADELDALRKALASLGTDWAAMIPESMLIELIEAKKEGNAEIFERLANYLDQQVSKAVLGQTATTDAIAGGHAVGRVHEEVREDIMQSDCIGLCATFARDVVRPIVDLNHGPQRRYPLVKLLLPEAVDIDKLSLTLERLVPLGLKVSGSEVREKLGLGEPADDDDLLTAVAPAPPPTNDPDGGPTDPRIKPERRLEADEDPEADVTAAAAEDVHDDDILDELAAAALAAEGDVAIEPMLRPLFDLAGQAGDYDAFLAALPQAFAAMDPGAMQDLLARLASNARGAGNLEIDTFDSED